MRRTVRLKNGVAYGTNKEEIVKIVPELEGSFTQRKEFFEYYFSETKVDLTIAQLDKLSREFGITIDFDDLTIDA